MAFRRKYQCGECGSKYNILELEKMGIHEIIEFGDCVWHCEKCHADNWFFNDEQTYMPHIDKVSLIS